jgi:anti-anti-sigma factor
VTPAAVAKRISDLSVVVQPNGPWLVLKVKGALDVLTTQRLHRTIAAQDGRGSSLLIDLSDLTFIDASGIHTLTDACAQNGTRVVCPPGDIRRVLDIVSFGDVACMHESLDDAVTAT